MSISHRVLCYGGRDFNDYDFVTQRLDELRAQIGDFAVIHGAAKGADRLAALWGKGRGLPVIEVAANWVMHGKAAGAIRNGWMLDFCHPTYAVAFPGGNGTADMTRRCEARGLTIWHPHIYR